MLALLVCVTAAGCVPYWSQPYLEPAAPDGRLARGRCPVPPNTLAFTLGDVETFVFAYQNRERLSIGMRFSVPAGRVVRRLDAEAVIRLSGRPDALVAHFGEVTSSGADPKLVTMPVGTTMAGASRPILKGSARLVHQMFTVRTTVTTERSRSRSTSLDSPSTSGR